MFVMTAATYPLKSLLSLLEGSLLLLKLFRQQHL